MERIALAGREIGESMMSGANACGGSGARGFPVRRGKNDRPERRVRLIELEGDRKIIIPCIFYPDHPAALFHPVFRVHDKDGLTGVHVHLHPQQAPVGIHHLRKRFFLPWLPLDVFGGHRDLHLQHHALASPAVDWIGKVTHGGFLKLRPRVTLSASSLHAPRSRSHRTGNCFPPGRARKLQRSAWIAAWLESYLR